MLVKKWFPPEAANSTPEAAPIHRVSNVIIMSEAGRHSHSLGRVPVQTGVSMSLVQTKFWQEINGFYLNFDEKSMKNIVFERFSESVGLCNSFWRIRKHGGGARHGAYWHFVFFIFSNLEIFCAEIQDLGRPHCQPMELNGNPRKSLSELSLSKS